MKVLLDMQCRKNFTAFVSFTKTKKQTQKEKDIEQDTRLKRGAENPQNLSLIHI